MTTILKQSYNQLQQRREDGKYTFNVQKEKICHSRIVYPVGLSIKSEVKIDIFSQMQRMQHSQILLKEVLPEILQQNNFNPAENAEYKIQQQANKLMNVLVIKRIENNDSV